MSAPIPTPEAIAEFWTDIKPFGWGTKTTDHVAIERRLLREWTPEKARKAQDVFQHLQSKMFKALRNVREVSEDSFGDLVAHIIGLGQAEYEAVLADPMLAQERASTGNYAESFSYALPFSTSFEKLDPAFYASWAARAIESFKRGLMDDRFEPVHPDMRLLVEILADVAREHPMAIVDREQDARAAAEAIDERSNWLFRGHGSFGDSFSNPHVIYNLINDIKAYYAPQLSA